MSEVDASNGLGRTLPVRRPDGAGLGSSHGVTPSHDIDARRQLAKVWMGDRKIGKGDLGPFVATGREQPLLTVTRILVRQRIVVGQDRRPAILFGLVRCHDVPERRTFDEHVVPAHREVARPQPWPIAQVEVGHHPRTIRHAVAPRTNTVAKRRDEALG